jgi:hypothetical protein
MDAACLTVGNYPGQSAARKKGPEEVSEGLCIVTGRLADARRTVTPTDGLLYAMALYALHEQASWSREQHKRFWSALDPYWPRAGRPNRTQLFHLIVSEARDVLQLEEAEIADLLQISLGALRRSHYVQEADRVESEHPAAQSLSWWSGTLGSERYVATSECPFCAGDDVDVCLGPHSSPAAPLAPFVHRSEASPKYVRPNLGDTRPEDPVVAEARKRLDARFKAMVASGELAFDDGFLVRGADRAAAVAGYRRLLALDMTPPEVDDVITDGVRRGKLPAWVADY